MLPPLGPAHQGRREIGDIDLFVLVAGELIHLIGHHRVPAKALILLGCTGKRAGAQYPVPLFEETIGRGRIDATEIDDAGKAEFGARIGDVFERDLADGRGGAVGQGPLHLEEVIGRCGGCQGGFAGNQLERHVGKAGGCTVEIAVGRPYSDLGQGNRQRLAAIAPGAGNPAAVGIGFEMPLGAERWGGFGIVVGIVADLVGTGFFLAEIDLAGGDFLRVERNVDALGGVEIPPGKRHRDGFDPGGEFDDNGGGAERTLIGHGIGKGRRGDNQSERDDKERGAKSGHVGSSDGAQPA